jgi:ribosomal protein S18 acetylase RimI-like enzyme
MIAALTIRALRSADVTTLTGVLGRAYRSRHSFEPRLRAYLRMRRVATFVADLGGEPVGMVVGNDYGPVAYVSQMGVDPAVQRRGVGMALMDALIAWADERAFAVVELDATPAGAPLYAKYGFREAGQTLGYEAVEHGGDRRNARPYVAADRDAVFAADAGSFGADRSEVLQLLLDDAENTIVVCGRPAVSGSPARIAGYAIAQRRAETLGPVIARDATIAAGLIDAARTHLAPLHRLNVPSENQAGCAIVAARGYRLARTLAHMTRGAAPPARGDRLYARINLGQG